MKTFDEIMADMLLNVSNELDKREGSVIYTALAPCAKELAEMYIDLETCLNLAFAGTSQGIFLDMRVNEMGIERLPATNSIRKGEFRDGDNNLINIEIGSRLGIDNLNYVIIEKISDGIFKLQCETAGSAGNNPIGEMLPITYIQGLAKAIISDVLVAGTDEETDENLLERYQLKVREPTTSGNAYNYKKWALEISGVGDAKIFPLWNGNGTVKVVIIDGNKQPVIQDTIDRVKTHIEEMRPIGATVTVVSGISKPINVSASLILQDGYTIADVSIVLESNIRQYFKETAFKTNFISYAKIGLIILSVPGILDYQNLLLNNDTTNISIVADEVPNIGTITLEELTV